MSAYKEIKTQFRTLDSLLKALSDLGYATSDIVQASNVRTNTVTMQGYGGRTAQVAVALRLKSKGAYEDVGFAWSEQDKAYRAIVSTHDSGNNFGQAKLTKLIQRYATHEAIRLAKREGHSVREISRDEYKRKHGTYPADGSVCLEVITRSTARR